jgi:hypothetical protein
MVCFLSAILTLASARPAAAQVAKIDLASGIQSFTSSYATSPGWWASFAGGNEWIKAVGDVAGLYYEGGAKLHTFQGGVELASRYKRAVPFVRVLSGVAVFSGYGRSDTNFVLTPEGGVKVMVNDHLGVQTSVGFPLIDGFYMPGGFRAFAGIVIRK